MPRLLRVYGRGHPELLASRNEPELRLHPRRAHAAYVQWRPSVRRGGLQRSRLGGRYDQSGKYSTEYTQQLLLLTRKKHNARGNYPRAYPCRQSA